jgi:hypothetical protein
VSRGKNLRKMKRSAMDIRSSSKPIGEKLRKQDPLGFEVSNTEVYLRNTVIKHNDQTYITMQLQQLDWIIHARALQCKREKTTWETD